MLLRRLGMSLEENPQRARLVALAGLVVLIVSTAWLVQATGGIRFSYAHLMYVPVVLAGIAFEVPGGFGAAVVGGLILGPWMPMNTDTGEMQAPLNWVYRMVFFAFVGVLVGAWAHLRRRHSRELEWLYEHHRDNGLLNLTGLLKRMDARLRADHDQKLVVSITQLDNFIEIQNTFGPAFATRLLAAVVARARRVLPQSSLVALIQPDRLAMVVAEAETAQLSGAQIEAAIADSYVVEGLPIHVGASIGVAVFPTHARTGEELLQKAEIAMRWTASRHATVSVYDAANDRSSRDNLILLGAVPAAIKRGEFEVWHQAKLALATGEIAGMEALLRWNHPERGFVPPGRFIPQLEETMLINPVTHAVIAGALAAAGGWRTAGFRMRVSVNLSVRNLLDDTLLKVLDRVRRDCGLEPGDVELEVTESAVMAEPQQCIRLINELRDGGYGVAIDDFGVGHSSLSYLRKLRVSALKIDQEFVKTLATETNNQKIVRSVLHLAGSLGLESIAEGVEDERSLELLRHWGCDYAQGFLIHRPAPAEEVSALLAQSKEKVARQSEPETAPQVR